MVFIAFFSTNKRGAQPTCLTSANSACNSVKCQVAAPFVWEVPPPFAMSPSEGVVEVGESKAVTCSIKPSAASVFVSQAVLTVGQGVNAIKPKPLLDMKARIAHRQWQGGTGVELMGVAVVAALFKVGLRYEAMQPSIIIP